MTAAIPLDYLTTGQRWRDGDKELALWGEALKLYLLDARAYQRRSKSLDDGEAWRDLHSERRLLARLCAPVGLEVPLIADLMLRVLAAQRPKE